MKSVNNDCILRVESDENCIDCSKLNVFYNIFTTAS